MTGKLTILFTLILTAFSANCQDSTNFEYWISDLDKAGSNRMTYHITSDSIQVKSGPYDFIYFKKSYEKDKVVFSSVLSFNQQKLFRKLDAELKNDSLKSVYSNLCIIDGLILHFHFEWKKKEISTTLSNFYLEKMEPFVEFVNTVVPEKFIIKYNEEWLKKAMSDCPDELILD